MATTGKIPDELAAEMEFETSSRHLTLTEAGADLLRHGLAAEGSEPRSGGPFVIKARAIGLHTGLRYDDVEGRLEYGEGAGLR